MATNKSLRQWQYSWEALSHVRILRLYLMHPSLSPTTDCLQLTVSLCPPDYVHFNGVSLLIRWVEEPSNSKTNGNGHPYSPFLRLPVPPVVLDHSIPVQYKAMTDHIEAKLVLMLPVDHPLVGSLSSLLGSSDGGISETQSSFSLDNDTQALAREGEVHFYCKNCSTRLTREPLRFFKELPSVDWRDVADNWFGTCCCSFGGVSQSLVSNFEKFSSMSKGTCFVGSTSITVSMDDLSRDAIIEHSMRIVPNNDEDLKQSGKNNDIPVQSNLKDENLVQNQKHISKEWECLSSHNIVEMVGTLSDAGENILEKREKNRNNCIGVSDLLLERTKTENAILSYTQGLETMLHAEKNEVGILASDFSGLSCKDTNLSVSTVDPPLQFVNEHFSRFPTFEDPVLNCEDNCCTTDFILMPTSDSTCSAPGTEISVYCCDGNDSENASLKQSKITSGSQHDRMSAFSFYLRNGFMMGPSGVSSTVEWVAVHCSSCLSLIGSYPDVKGKPVSANEIIQPVSANEIIQLFKCHISSSEAVGELHDVFRRHTLQRIFVNQLQANAEDESSYRTVIRDLKTKVPMLQMVLVNTKIWFFSGDCCEREMQGEDCVSDPEFLEDSSKGTGVTKEKASKVTTAGTEKGNDCINLVPVVKVLFCDCSNYTPDESRAINEWALQKHAEDIFMLEEEIKALTEALMAVKLRLPASCSSLEGFYLSFLEK